MKKILLILFVFFSLFASAQMTQIQINSVKRYDTYVEVSYKMRFTLPAIYGTGTNPIAGLNSILASYAEGYSSEVIPVTGTVITLNETKSFDLATSLASVRTFLQNRYTTVRTALDNLTLSPSDNLAGQKWDGTSWASSATITDNPIPTDLNSAGTATGAAGAAVTLTIPAVKEKFHNISHVSIVAYSTAARTGGATPVTVTTTNLPGNPAFTFPSAAAVGTTIEKTIEPTQSIKSSVANTATTIVCPATTSVIWRVIVFYNTTN